MPLKICIFGNSHLAALRTAYMKSPKKWPDLDVKMVGAHKLRLLETDIIDGVLTPLSDGARESFDKFGGGTGVDLRYFDAFVITGCQVSSYNIATLHRDARYVGLPSLEETPDIARMTATLMSRSGFEHTARKLLTGQLGMRFARRLRDATTVPILFADQAHVSQGAIKSDHKSYNSIQRIVRLGDAPEVARIFHSTVDNICDEYSLTHLPQPAKTIARQVLTKREYSEGSIRLAATGQYKHPKDDFTHTNADYGSLVMDQITEALRRP